MKKRNSNFELLRLVAIFFVILHHLVIKGADTVGYITEYSVETKGVWGVLINAFAVGGGEFICFYFRMVWHKKCMEKRFKIIC